MSADGRAEESPQQRIQSIEVGAQVLRALEAGRGPMVLSEVARNCAMQPAKVHRYLVSLVRAGLASQDAEADGLADALRSTAGPISAALRYRPA
jgi:hypothetical protein